MLRHTWSPLGLVLLLAVTSPVASSSSQLRQAGSATPLSRSGAAQIARIEQFYVGGRAETATHPNAGASTPVVGASMTVEQTLVHHIVPSQITEPYPIVMVPGLGLSSYLYMGTPDGREGWASLIARAGFEVYVFDDPLTSPSGGFDVSAFNAAKTGDANASDQPELSIWTREEIWSRWGFGSDVDVPYVDTRFPVAHVDQFYASIPVRHAYPPGSGQFGSNFKADVLVELLERTGPAILMLHSAGGQTGVKAARSRPDLVPAFVLLEPAGIPVAGDFPDFAGKDMLGIYGDYLVERNQTGRLTSTQEAAVLFNQNGGVGEVVVMTDLGVSGNTHIMMQDDNSHDIAGIVVSWLRTNVN